MSSERDTSDELARLGVKPPAKAFSVMSDPAPKLEHFQGVTAVVASQVMRNIMTVAARVGRTNSPVLITGESGTGKEIIARAIHQNSPRASRPLIDVNCAALPEHLVESELFGYEKGAFSGAESMKPGLFEAANGGTLFLDEIGEIEAHVQAKLLRVLDGQPHFRLGGTRRITVDVRIVAATNLNLEEATSTGRFRTDLYHRLDAFHIHVPPLRERTDDIVPLAEFFLRDTGLSLSHAARTRLLKYSWPGNIRELRNALNKASVYCTGAEIQPEDLPIDIHAGKVPAADGFSLDGMEQKTILKVLKETGGHQQKAADLLGISRRTLIRKLKLYRTVPQTTRSEPAA